MLGSDFEEISYLSNLMVLQAYSFYKFVIWISIYVCPSDSTCHVYVEKLTNDDINELLQCEDEIPSDSDSNADSESEGEDEAFEPDRNKEIISSSSSSESESDCEVTNIAKKRKSMTTEEAPNIKWTKIGMPTPSGNFTSSSGPAQNIFDLENPTPYDICSEFIRMMWSIWLSVRLIYMHNNKTKCVPQLMHKKLGRS